MRYSGNGPGLQLMGLRGAVSKGKPTSYIRRDWEGSRRRDYSQQIQLRNLLRVRAEEEESKKEGEEERPLKDVFDEGMTYGNDVRDMVLSRFTSPVIDDIGLPLSDAMVVATSSVLVAIVVIAGHLVKPSWLAPLEWVPAWRSLPYIVPAFSHGSLLALCWTLGALAAQAFEKKAWTTRTQAIAITAKAWAFAVSLMIVGVQIGLIKESLSNGVLPFLGENEAMDMLAVSRYSELIVDAGMMGVLISIWRQYRVNIENWI